MRDARSLSQRILDTLDRSVALVGLLAVTAPIVGLAVHSAMALGGHDVPTVFFIEKSENRNQIHYGIRLDAQCRPVGTSPVHAYWRDLEEGPSVTSPLLGREQPAYGIGVQYARASEQGGTVRMRLRAYPSRVVVIETGPVPGACAARALTTIAGQRARLVRIFAQIGFLSVDHIVLHGRTLAGGRAVQERLEP